MIISLYIDIFDNLVKFLNLILNIFQKILNFVKMKIRDFNLIINDLGYSSKIKEIIF